MDLAQLLASLTNQQLIALGRVVVDSDGKYYYASEIVESIEFSVKREVNNRRSELESWQH